MKFLIILLLCIPLYSYSQVIDDFSDGDFTSNPTWIGTYERFNINSNHQLQLNHTETGKAYLSTLIGLSDSLEWRFSIRLAFNPSSGNYGRVYLLADTSDLSDISNGYYLQFGEARSDDAIELFYKQDTILESVCRGTTGKISSAFDIDVWVTYRSSGQWKVAVDWEKNGNFINECNGQNHATSFYPFFGFYCSFTNSNKTNFYFDDIRVDYIYIDTEPPRVDSLAVDGKRKIKLFFNEAVDTLSSQNTSNYNIEESSLTPFSAERSLSDSKEVVITFQEEIPPNKNLTLNISNIKDLANNNMLNSNMSFSYSHAFYADLVFNEMMIKPNPSVGLPETEYIEVYNRAPYSLQLKNWKLRIGESDKLFSRLSIGNGEYLILCHNRDVDSLKSFGNVMGFSSFSLSNAGQSICLLNEFDEVVDQLAYNNQWYQNSAKAAGGWSIEKIQPEDLCLEKENWKASEDSTGGTPGKVNSIYSSIQKIPEVISTEIISDTIILLVFNQIMDEESLLDTLNYSVNPTIRHPKQIRLMNNHQAIELTLSSPLLLGTEYSLSVSKELINCIGQKLKEEQFFALELCKIASFADVVFNEIMADPSPTKGLPDAEFLEIFNKTLFPIDLSNWILKTADEEKVFQSNVLKSHQYLILCNSNRIDSLTPYGQVMGFSNFHLNNGEQELSLYSDSTTLIDQINYSSSWFQDKEDQEGGVSLEKIQVENVCTIQKNWSASLDPKGGTPGRKNSIYLDEIIMPEASRCLLINDSTISIEFNQVMEKESLNELLNYNVEPNSESPNQINIELDKQSIEIYFNSKFELGTLYNLSLSNKLINCIGQQLTGQLDFILELSKQSEIGDVVINEIMIDPQPIVGIPEVEYIELFNRTAYPINLSNWTLKIGDEEKIFPEYTMSSNSYLLLCSRSKQDSLMRFGPSIGFSGFNLTNDHEQIVLINKLGEIIDEVSYTDQWYHDNEKDGGGWSIEKIHPNNICLLESNWAASDSPLGGTPGEKNSIFSSLDILPEVSFAKLLNDSVVELAFNQKMDGETIIDSLNYSVNNNFGHPTRIETTPFHDCINLIFDSVFTLGTNYQLTLSDQLKNCSNKVLIGSNNFPLELAKTAERLDVIFNEIMADPAPPTGLPLSEYIELYNRTPFPINLNNWTIKIGGIEHQFSSEPLASKGFLMLCHSTQMENLSGFGPALTIPGFDLSNAGQSLILMNEKSEVIDKVSYTDEWYHDDEKSNGGWSLEKIYPDNFCLQELNWKASTDTLGGTPGKENSVFSPLSLPPEIIYFEMKNDSQLDLRFNQMMQSESINNDLNYKVNNGVGNPKYIQADSSFQYLELFFETKFLLGVDYQLSIDSSILDCSGHSILGTLQFPFVLPKNAEYGDVLINEIMAQPSPSNGLPNAEYLELYNQSEYPISLYHWTLKFGKSSFVFPKMLLEGRSFLLLSNNDDITLFNTSISTLGVSSLSLANGGSNLVLKNDQNQIIHFIKYSDSWYSEDYKAEGGWSLEMISPDYFCDQESNWSASENSKGGTPGEANSIAHLAVEEKAPRIISLDLLNPNTIQIQFSKTMDSVALKNSNNYTVSPDLGLLIQPRIYQPAYDLAQLQFVQDISAATIYHLDIDPGLAGCHGLEIENFSLPFSLPEEPEPGDIIINEVLFDSWPNDGDYVELYNCSNKVIDSRQLLFSHIPLDPFDSLYSSFPLKAGQIFPHTYLLLCKNKSAISSIYYSPENSNYCLTDEFPRLPNSEGEIGISKISSSSSFIDRFHYNVKMHHSLINNKKGVSLERISFQEETNNTNNWTSAASIVNFGTPGYQNSQHLEPGNSLDEISVSPEIFSPDLDGRDDLLQIDCHFKEPENTLNLIIFNAQGKRVRHLVKNDIMGLNAQYYWDGTWDDGNRAEYGIYILYFEYFNLMGEVKKVKKICVLGGVL